METLLSDQDVLSLIGGKAKMVTYPEINHFQTLDDLFGNDDKIIILYVNTVKGNDVSGHWTLLTRRRVGRKTIYEFMDSYGLMPDDQLKHYSKQWRRQSGQDRKILTELLYQCSLQPNCEVHYNELPMQRDNPNINTCGRWIAIRGHFYKIPLKQFQTIFKGFKDKGYDLDKLSVYLTEQLKNS